MAPDDSHPRDGDRFVVSAGRGLWNSEVAVQSLYSLANTVDTIAMLDSVDRRDGQVCLVSPLLVEKSSILERTYQFPNVIFRSHERKRTQR